MASLSISCGELDDSDHSDAEEDAQDSEGAGVSISEGDDVLDGYSSENDSRETPGMVQVSSSATRESPRTTSGELPG